MPRRNRSKREEPRGDLARALTGGVQRVSYAGRTWVARSVRGNDEGRVFRCPGCQAEFSSALAHEVVWPDDGLGGVQDRRHWHTACWRARDRRPPRGSY